MTADEPSANELIHDLLVSYEKLDHDLGTQGKSIANLEALLEAHLSVWTDGAEELDEWVDGWLMPTFGLDQVLSGWAKDPALRSELQALWIGYRRMAMAMEASFEPLVWHDHLAHVIDRVDQHRARRTQVEQFATTNATTTLLAAIGERPPTDREDDQTETERTQL